MVNGEGEPAPWSKLPDAGANGVGPVGYARQHHAGDHRVERLAQISGLAGIGQFEKIGLQVADPEGIGFLCAAGELEQRAGRLDSGHVRGRAWRASG